MIAVAKVANRGSNRLLDRSILVIEALVGFGVVAAIIGRTYGMAPTLVFLSCGLAAAFSGYVMLKMAAALSDDTLEVTGRVRDLERERLEHEKSLVLQGIKELEADHAVGKVDQADYAHLRKTAEARALEIIQALRKSDDYWAYEAERLVQKKLGKQATTGEPTAEDSDAWRAEDRATRERRAALGALFDDRPVEFEVVEIGDEKALLQCTGCDTKNSNDGRYCVGCGRPKQEAA